MRHPIALVAALALAALTGRSALAASTAEQIVAHHLSAAAAGAVDDLVSDYAASAVLITPDGVTKGKQAIHDVFQRLLGGPTRPALEVKKQTFEGEIGYLVWTQNAGTPNEVRGSDTFVVHHGKIVAQTVAIVPMAAHQ